VLGGSNDPPALSFVYQSDKMSASVFPRRRRCRKHKDKSLVTSLLSKTRLERSKGLQAFSPGVRPSTDALTL
jgi:hypothetical protein